MTFTKVFTCHVTKSDCSSSCRVGKLQRGAVSDMRHFGGGWLVSVCVPKEKCGQRKMRWQSVTLQLRAVHLHRAQTTNNCNCRKDKDKDKEKDIERDKDTVCLHRAQLQLHHSQVRSQKQNIPSRKRRLGIIFSVIRHFRAKDEEKFTKSGKWSFPARPFEMAS